ncbi:MAG: leucine-rich repeat domain-containing protein, partial [Clostridia bacterium]|nr:leucine-rich repeat domain-containing protein [Clostridia bacterium]
QYAFQNVISLTEITIPLSVTSINTKAFYGCTNLATVRNNSELDIVAGATTHGYVAYYATSVIVNTVTEGNVVYWVVSDKKIAIAPTSQDVTEITLANDCTSIKNNAFENVVGITSITIPASVTSIGDNAFYGCTNLATVYNNSELDIVAGATTHGYVAYYATVVYKNGEISSKFVTEDNVIYVVTETEKIAMGPTSLDVTTIALAEDCTSVKEEAFKDCASLTSVTISPSVTSIGNRAFKGCSSLNMYTNTIEDWLKMSFGRETFNNAYNLYVNNSLVTDLIIPNSVTEINANNFRYCNISTLTISQGIISIGQDAFSMCRSLTDIVLPSSLKTIGQESFSGCTALTKAIIPEGVETIEYWAFSSCAAITELTIPTTVKSIGAGAFGSCLRLTTINYNATSATLVRNPNHSNSGFSRAGQNGTGITLNIAANVQIIPEHLFYESSSTFATKITKVIFADGSNCKTIGDSAFWGCANLKSLILPASLTTIGVSTFRATGLTSITIPSGVTELGDCAFYGCSSLASVTIESTETSTLTIGEYVFANCTSLTSIIIPSSVTSIGDSTFGGCSSLATITIKE